VANARKTEAPQPLRLEAAISGLLAVTVARLEHDKVSLGRKLEVLLADAGLTYEEIGAVMGKSGDAVRKVVERSRKEA
jgi:DNA-directed RNA polymerase specialized sigma24 family protein